jgi:hypothetical protein
LDLEQLFDRQLGGLQHKKIVKDTRCAVMFLLDCSRESG